MSDTSSVIPGISSGKKQKPPIIVLFGPDGVGKTSFIAEAPQPVILGPEDGSHNMDIARFDDVKTWDDIRKNVKRLLNENLPFRTLGLDSLDHIERMLWAKVCQDSNSDVIENANGGYGKGFTRANQLWSELINDLKELRDKKSIITIAVAHEQVKAYNDPSQPLPYDRHILKLNEKAAALWRESADAVLYVTYETVVRKENKGDKKGRAYGEDKRVLYTQRRPSHDGKNRYGLPYQLSFELGYSWNTLYNAIRSGQPDSIEAVLAEINDLAQTIGADNATRMNTAVERAAGDIVKLIPIRNHARTIAAQAVQ